MTKAVTPLIIVGMLAGIVTGLIVHGMVSEPATLAAITRGFSLVTDVFLRLIRMIIGPLVLSTLTLGIARMGDTAAIGRVGLKALAWFVVASGVSLALAIAAMEIFQPGVGLHLTDAAVDHGAQDGLTLQGFIARVFPTSVFDALARNEILQVVVFSLFAGMACATIKTELRDKLLGLLDSIAAVMLKMTGYVMWVAPLGVFAALASTVATQGFGVVGTYVAFILEFYGALALLWVVLLTVATLTVKQRLPRLIKAFRGPALIAFSTASSEAAYPLLLANLEAFGIPNRIASFVLPLGYAFNLCGSMLYCAMATMFAAQAYDVPLPSSRLALMSALLFVASKGIAPVPRAAMLVVVATLPYLHIPIAALPLLLAIDQILDMGRTCTNTVANAVAAATVARWEGQLMEPVEAPALQAGFS